MKFCPECGKKINKAVKFCPECGENIGVNKEETNEISDDDSIWTCEYCDKEFESETSCLRHEKNCKSKGVRKVVVTHSSSSAWAWVIVIIIIAVVAVILMNMYGQQQYNSSVAGQIKSFFG